jgi:Cdc6-like AAA superfamily ATPase
MYLKEIDFGRDVAEFDRHLADFFLETDAYDQVKCGNKSLFIGRKGTGKTAILKYSVDTENKSREYAIPIEATHSTYVKIDENLRSFTSQIKNIDSSFKLAWLFTTLLALVDRLTKESIVAITKEERELYDFAKDNLNYHVGDPISAIAGYASAWIKNLKSIGPVEREVVSNAKQIIFDEARVIQLIRASIDRINKKGRRVFLLYDRLDDRWDGSALYKAFLQGLLLASKDLKATGLDVAPVVFLRDEIFEEIARDFQHIDHYRMEIQRIEWDEQSLVELLALRIKSSLNKKGHRLEGESPEVLWNMVFPTTLPARKAPIPSTAYLVERTLFRSRDIVLFATYIKNLATKRRHTNIEVEDIQQAEEQYSKDKLRDLVAEHSYRMPQIDSVFEEFRYKKMGFDLDDLRLLMVRIKEKHGRSIAWLSQPEDSLIKILYRIGFISFTARGGVLRGTRVIHSGVNPDEKVILEQDRVYVSPIFRKALDLKE